MYWAFEFHAVNVAVRSREMHSRSLGLLGPLYEESEPPNGTKSEIAVLVPTSYPFARKSYLTQRIKFSEIHVRRGPKIDALQD